MTVHFKKVSEYLRMSSEERQANILSEALKDNCWQYDAKHLTVAYCHQPYSIELREITTSAVALDFIVQVSKKGWATPKVTGDLVRLMDAILDFQGRYCSFRTECGPVDPSSVAYRGLAEGN